MHCASLLALELAGFFGFTDLSPWLSRGTAYELDVLRAQSQCKSPRGGKSLYLSTTWETAAQRFTGPSAVE